MCRKQCHTLSGLSSTSSTPDERTSTLMCRIGHEHQWTNSKAADGLSASWNCTVPFDVHGSPSAVHIGVYATQPNPDPCLASRSSSFLSVVSSSLCAVCTCNDRNAGPACGCCLFMAELSCSVRFALCCCLPINRVSYMLVRVVLRPHFRHLVVMCRLPHCADRRHAACYS